jgi:fermentation-respiration switch protein FrsA (DUF1100 family)
MAITTLLDPSLLPARTMDEPAFNAAVAYLMTNFPVWGAQVNSTLAGMNIVAAGGAMGVQYTFDTATTNADPGSGKIRMSASTAAATTAIYMDVLGSDGSDYTGILDQFDASSSTVKGYLLMRKASDPTKWAVFAVNGRTTVSGYRAFNVTCVTQSTPSPFSASDPVTVQYTRNGDMGPAGTAYVPLSAKFSDRKATSTSGGVSTGNSTAQVRTLNTTDQNTIPSGVALASNRVTVPAGTYDVRGRAPAYAVGTHRAFLWNVTSGSLALLGSSAHSSSGGSSSDSEFSGRLVLGTSTQFEVRHYTAIGTNSTDLGVGTGVSGQVEVFTEVEFIKVA